MSERAIHLGVLVGALALAGWVFGAHGRGAPSMRSSRTGATDTTEATTSPLAIIPPGSAFVLTADIAGLEARPLGAVLAGRFGRLGSGTADLQKLCGFDPLAALDELVLAVPSAGAAASEHGDDFGVVATGRFSAAQIMRCAQASIAARGGEPVSTELGKFSSVRDRKAASGEVAARDGGPLIVSGGAYFRELLDAADGNGTRLEHEDPGDARHAELRRALGPGNIVATWLLPATWFERVAGDSGARLSPLKSLKAIGARIEVSDRLRVTLLLDCADAGSVTEIQSLLTQLRSALGGLPIDPELRGIAERASARQDGRRLWVELTIDQTELEALLDAALGAAPTALPPKSPPPTGGTRPDTERIPTK